MRSTHDPHLSTRARYFLITLIALWLLTFPTKGVLFQLSLYLLPLSVLALKGTRTLLREHAPYTLLPLTLLLCLPVLVSEILYVLSAHTGFSKEPFSAFWRLALFPSALATACIASGVSQKKLQYMLLGIAMLYAITGLLSLMTDMPLDGRDWGGRAAGLVFNPNPFGLLMAAATLVSVHLLLGAARRGEQLVAVIFAWVFIVACLASGSRSAVLGLVTTLLLMLLWHCRKLYGFKPRDYLIPLSAISIAVITLAYLFTQADFMTTLTQRFSQASRGDIRLEIWTYYLKQAAENPLLGLPSRAIARFPWGDTGYGAHNIYLDTLLRSGLIGLTALLVCIAAVIRILIASTNPEKTIALPLLFLLCLFGLFSGSIYSNEMIQGIFAIVLSIAIFSLLDMRQQQTRMTEHDVGRSQASGSSESERRTG
ncbi:MAG: O-antigen ligase family protein [Thiohalobacteraceae bacterium]